MSKTGNAADTLAFDRASMRSYDQDGHLRVEGTPISKANVCPYYGREIPDWESLGLAADKLYRLFRDPEELQKAAATFNGKPLLIVHRPVSAEDHEHQVVAGSVGNPVWDAPYLRADLSLWDGKAIKAVEDRSQKELSSSYRYRADMTPGSFQGAQYDGVMRDIAANHVALVKEGRAGPDVVVGDAQITHPPTPRSFFAMAKPNITRGGAAALATLSVYLKPKLAQDAKLNLAPVLAKLTRANFKTSKPAIIAGIKKGTEGKLAQDANIDDVTELLDALEDALPVEVVEPGETAGSEMPGITKTDEEEPAKDSDADDIRTFLAGKLSDDDLAQVMLMIDDHPAMDGEPNAKKSGKDGEPKDMVSKPAMDAAIAAAVKVASAAGAAAAVKAQKDIRDAERAVRPYVGDLAMAHDSADDVYRTALTSLNVAVEGVHPSAFPALLALLPKAGDTPRRQAAPLAQDAAAAKDYDTRFPNANRLKL